MKKLWLIALLIICMACDEDYSVDPTLLPPVTATGEETLGCLVDGWVYSSERFGYPVVRIYSVENGDSVVVRANVGREGELFTFSMINPEEGKTIPYMDSALNGKKLENGLVTVSRMGGGVLSGTFEGGSVTRGRFDVKYNK